MMGNPTPTTRRVPNIVVAFLTIINILNNNNYSVHTYTSPHLEKFS